MTESVLQQQIIKEAKKRGVLALKVEAVARRGLPDLLLIYNGRTVHVEVKSPKGTGRLSVLQTRMIDTLRSHGAEVFVVDSLKNSIELLDSML